MVHITRWSSVGIAFVTVVVNFIQFGLRRKWGTDATIENLIQFGTNWIVMEYVRGGTLESLIHKLARVDVGSGVHVDEQTLRIAASVGRAIRYLHEKRIIHRDVKPAYIFLSATTVGSISRAVKLGDFGVAKWGDFLAAAASGTLTATQHQGLGTLKYMSPEQAVKPRDVSVRSDMYGFGITLFELFTGQILPSPHHVFEIMRVRTTRDSITGKLYSLGIRCTPADEQLFELILDMFLAGPSGRPASAKTTAFFEYYLDRLFGTADESYDF